MSVAWFGPGSPSDWGDEDPGFAVVSGVMQADSLPSWPMIAQIEIVVLVTYVQQQLPACRYEQEHEH